MPQYLYRLTDNLTAWARARKDIIAIGVVGSVARGSQQVGSDIDLIILADKPVALLKDTQWIGRFGTLTSDTPEDYGLVQSLRCVDDGGTEIEFGIAPGQWCNPPIDPETIPVIAAGLLIIYDPRYYLTAALDWVKAHGNFTQRAF